MRIAILEDNQEHADLLAEWLGAAGHDCHLYPRGRDLLRDAAEPALAGIDRVTLNVEVHTAYRTVGARLSGEIARRHGDAGLPEGTLTINATGSAGQSFGAFLAPGVALNLVGESNDYVGKGMHGGTIAVSPPPNASWLSAKPAHARRCPASMVADSASGMSSLQSNMILCVSGKACR